MQVLSRMEADEQDISAWFSTHLRPDRMAKPLAHLAGLRTLMATES